MHTNVPMPKRNSSLSPKMNTMLGVALLFSGLAATASAQDYSAFQTAFGATGTTSLDGSTITFALVRQDQTALTIKLPGTSAIPAPPEAVANGYVNVQKSASGPSTYFVDGAFPALTSELPTLEAVLEFTGLPITAIAQETAGLSKQITTVHIEGTITQPASLLALNLSSALATIQNPQKNVLIQYPGIVFSTIPPKFQAIVNSGTFQLIDSSTVVFSLPRNDVTPITLGSVIATPSVGVGQTVIFAGNGQSVITAELALTQREVQQVSDVLIAGGFTLSSQGDYFTNDSKRLTMLHAVATAGDVDTFYVQAEYLGKAILVTTKK